MQKYLICTDLDRTLIPNGEPDEFPEARTLFRQLVSHPEIALAYVSGRHLELIQEAIDDFQLPMPDYAIADVGSSIYTIHNDRWSRLAGWDREMSDCCPTRIWKGIHSHIDDLSALRLQEESKQGVYKISYYISLEIEIKTLISEIEKRLNHATVQTKLIWSIDEQLKSGLIDILPRNADKRLAIEYLMDAYEFDLSNTFFSGDSGNDISVFSSPIPATLVAKASDDVKQQAYHTSKENNCLEALYIAKGDDLGMNGNYGAGILEGLFHFLPQTKQMIDRYV